MECGTKSDYDMIPMYLKNIWNTFTVLIFDTFSELKAWEIDKLLSIKVS